MACHMKAWTFVLVVALCPLVYVILFQQGVIYRDSSYGTDRAAVALRVATQSPEPPMKRVLLVTYGRSGSTFLSYILKETPDAFFFFEPLRALLISVTRGMDVIMSYDAIGGNYFPPQELPVSNLTSYERHAVGVMNDLLNCDISKYPVTNFRSNHFLLHGDVAQVANCLWSMVNATYLHLSNYLQCLLHFFYSCQRAPLRVFKVIRLPVRSLFPLMRQFPDLSVIYLVRDPRAILVSQRQLFGHAPLARDFCRMVVDDVQHMKLLTDTFPDRTLTVRYEDISTDPMEWTRRLYSALGLKMTSQVLRSVRKMTSAPRQAEGAYTSFRSDSKEAGERWRTRIPLSDVIKSERVCGHAYKLLGYRKASSKSVLRNLNISLVEPRAELPLL
ncbi:carbohydrate sulfotransferase 3-like [Littorina saxatilis]